MEKERNRILKVGDIYRFRYNEEFLKDKFEPYHCFDGLMTVKESDKGLVLIDGYWSSGNRWFTIKDALEQGDLTFICNLDEVETISEYDSKYFNEKDIYIVPFHSGYRTVIYKRKGAEKCRETILKVLEAKVSYAKSSVESAERSLEWAERDLEKAKVEQDIDEIYV